MLGRVAAVPAAPDEAAAMHLRQLRVEGLRCIEASEIEAHRRLNLLVGPNGAGKTSILEAIHCLSTGRSFRAGQHEHLIRRGSERLRVTARVCCGGVDHRLGFERDRGGWRARLDAEVVSTLGDLASFLGVLCFEPESHALIAGPAEGRRRLVDLALFHVEPTYLSVWRRYQRALRQRNAALRAKERVAICSAWDGVLSDSGEQLAALRRGWCERLAPQFARALGVFLPDMACADALRWRAGWDQTTTLEEVLAASGERDRELGYTVAGPHRGDLRIQIGAGLGRYELSRGQQKLVALALTLATAAAMTGVLGWSPVLLLDDLPSELDPQRLRASLSFLRDLGAQLWLTSTELPESVNEFADFGWHQLVLADGCVQSRHCV